MNSDVLAMRMSALGRPMRLAMYRKIIASGERGISPGMLATSFDIQHTLVSYHLQPLLASGLATVEKRGREMIYRSDPAALSRLAASILELSSDAVGGNGGSAQGR